MAKALCYTRFALRPVSFAPAVLPIITPKTRLLAMDAVLNFLMYALAYLFVGTMLICIIMPLLLNAFTVLGWLAGIALIIYYWFDERKRAHPPRLLRKR